MSELKSDLVTNASEASSKGRFVVQIRKVRNARKLSLLMLSMQQCVGQIRGVWYMCQRMNLDSCGSATIVFVPRADKGCIEPYDRNGVACGPFQVYSVADFKSILWAIRRYHVA
jgi:hypothetical protein